MLLITLMAVAAMTAQGVEKIARMAEAHHSAAQATTASAQALCDRTAWVDQTLARFRVA